MPVYQLEGEYFWDSVGGRKCCKEQRSGIVFSVKWHQRSHVFMHEKLPTVASFLTETLKLVMKHFLTSWLQTWKKRNLKNSPCYSLWKEHTLQSHNVLFLISSRGASAAQLLYYVPLFLSWFNELKWDETHSFLQDRTKALQSRFTDWSLNSRKKIPMNLCT